MASDKTLAAIGFSLEQAYDATNEGVGTALIAALNAVADATPLPRLEQTPLVIRTYLLITMYFPIM